jgi:biopolymer transport protein ExbB
MRRLHFVKASARVLLAAVAAIILMTSAHAQSPAPETWWNEQWAMRKKITIDASPTGAVIAEPIGTAPVLVRLHAGNFGQSFKEVAPNGADLRFVAGDDKTLLNFQIERFDAEKSEALIWVKVPNINPNSKTEFWMYWSNEAAPALTAQDGKGAFDNETKLVYHFTENNLPAQDATVWNNVTQGLMTPAPNAIIGQGAQLGGEPLAIPGTPQIGWGNNAALTVMGWFKMTAQQSNAVIYSRRDGAAGFILGVDNGAPFVEISTGLAGVQRASAAVLMEPGKWYHLAAVADGTLVTLYLNGNGVATLIAQVPELKSIAFLGGDTPVAVAPVAPADPAAVAPVQPADPGASPQLDTSAVQPAPAEPAPEAAAALVTNPGFAGEADEFSIHFVARPQGYIRLAAIGQGGEQMGQLITYSVPQETSAWLTGTYGVLIKAVKPAEWVVIGLLGVMFLASMWVAISKNAYIGGQAGSNRRFIPRFEALARDLWAVDRGDDKAILTTTKGKVTSGDRQLMRNSSLYRLYEAGVDEIRVRVGSGSHKLSAEGLASIRATMDAVLVREIQKLRSRMIVLTIAISGGPFLGLLGTVMGVMTTFAAIALAGEVNVNAIAPGVAGALVATVAGLIVAIPALFIYNILITRVNDLTSDMQVFVDEFITKMSEHYSEMPERPQPALAQRAAAE